jgi:hypothetical protein
LPRFTTISPTHIQGMKEYAWNKFLEGKYASIGWLSEDDLTGKSIEQVANLIRKRHYSNEAYAIDAFTKFLTLEDGDYVAVNNTNAGLFGIGRISSGYYYKKNGHDTGSDDKDEFYSHFRGVNWVYTNYVRRKDIMSAGEIGWKPFGTIGTLENEVPPYIQRLLGIMPKQKQKASKRVIPDYAKSIISSIERLKADPNHQERGHESLVEDLFCALGYVKHSDIKYRLGRVDVSIWEGKNMLAIVEVKKDWNLSLYNSPKAVQQAYNYALDQGARYVILTNGDYYAIFDRLKGLTTSSNLIGEFRLSALTEDETPLVDRMAKSKLTNSNVEELFRYLSECFRRAE